MTNTIKCPNCGTEIELIKRRRKMKYQINWIDTCYRRHTAETEANTKEEAEQTIKKQYRRILLSIKEVKECLPR